MDADPIHPTPTQKVLSNFPFVNLRDLSSNAFQMENVADENRASLAVYSAAADVSPSKEAFTTENQKFKCPECDAGFTSEVQRYLHYLRNCTPATLKREARAKLFNGAKASSEHMATGEIAHQEEFNLEDSESVRMIEGEPAGIKALNEHMCTGEIAHQNGSSVGDFESVRMVEGEPAEKSYQCKLCTKTFTSNNLFKRHMLYHMGNHSFQGELCKKEFHFRSSLKLPGLTRKKVCFYQCVVCNQEFHFRHTLDTHKCLPVSHDVPQKRQENEICETDPLHPKCDKMFLDQDELNPHESDEHNSVHMGKSKRCSKIVLEHWIITHSRDGVVEYLCAVCFKTFSNEAELRKHQLIHAALCEDKLRREIHRCKVCPMKFIEKDDLCKHKKVHIEQKPYECELCMKTFSCKSAFHMHKVIHTRRKPFECQFCTKTFYQRSKFDTHRRMHEVEKEFFSKFRMLGLDRYTLGHHSGKKELDYECEICSKKFSRKSNLEEHRLVHEHEKEICNKFSILNLDQQRPGSSRGNKS